VNRQRELEYQSSNVYVSPLDFSRASRSAADSKGKAKAQPAPKKNATAEAYVGNATFKSSKKPPTGGAMILALDKGELEFKKAAVVGR